MTVQLSIYKVSVPVRLESSNPLRDLELFKYN